MQYRLIKGTLTKVAPCALLALSLLGCGGDNSSNVVFPDEIPDNALAEDPATIQNREFAITVINNTIGQPLSPVAVVLHDFHWQSFEVGAPASLAIETLAESGNNAPLAELVDQKTLAYQFEGGTNIIAPGQRERVTIAAQAQDGLSLSVLTMLVNTNDAFAALNGATISELSVGETITLNATTYDTGTEANSETAETITGPASGGLGEGFNASRDDRLSTIHHHPGVVTQADGLPNSTLQENHRWGEPAVRIQISRVE